MNDETKGCPEVRERIPLYVGGDLDPGALKDVGEHLAGCEVCAREARAALAAREVFRSQLAAGAREALRPAPELWVGVRAALVAEGGLARTTDSRGPSGAPLAAGAAGEIRPAPARLRVLRRAGGLAAAAAVVLVAVLAWTAGLAGLDRYGAGDGGATGATTPAIVVSRPLPEPDGTLRRIAPGDARPLEGAQDVRITNGNRAVPPVPPTENALAGERRLRRFR